MAVRTQHEAHEWYVCGACGQPRLQAWMSDATLNGETKAKPSRCIMTYGCDGRMAYRITQEDAYVRLGITRMVGVGGQGYVVDDKGIATPCPLSA